MKFFALLLSTLLIALLECPVSSQEISKELITSNGKKRAYYLFVPEKLNPATPLIVLLHGSGRNGLSLVEKWKDLAKKEMVILVGPDALNPQNWNIPGDGPGYIHELVEALKAKYPLNARRVYLFGHSAGAGQALYLSLLESEYFAATAIHAGALHGPQDNQLIEYAKRKIPIAIFVGTVYLEYRIPGMENEWRCAAVAAGLTGKITNGEALYVSQYVFSRCPQSQLSHLILVTRLSRSRLC